MTGDRVEITDGIVQSCTINGIPQLDRVGWYLFYVTVEEDGIEELVWEGASYADAIMRAEQLGHRRKLPVHDLVLGRPA